MGRLPNLGRRPNVLARFVSSKNPHTTQWECLRKFPHLIGQFIQIITNPKPKLSQALWFLITKIVLAAPGCSCVIHTGAASRSTWLNSVDSCGAGWNGSWRHERVDVWWHSPLLHELVHCWRNLRQGRRETPWGCERGEACRQYMLQLICRNWSLGCLSLKCRTTNPILWIKEVTSQRDAIIRSLFAKLQICQK